MQLGKTALLSLSAILTLVSLQSVAEVDAQPNNDSLRSAIQDAYTWPVNDSHDLMPIRRRMRAFEVKEHLGKRDVAFLTEGRITDLLLDRSSPVRKRFTVHYQRNWPSTVEIKDRDPLVFKRAGFGLQVISGGVLREQFVRTKSGAYRLVKLGQTQRLMINYEGGVRVSEYRAVNGKETADSGCEYSHHDLVVDVHCTDSARKLVYSNSGQRAERRGRLKRIELYGRGQIQFDYLYSESAWGPVWTLRRGCSMHGRQRKCSYVGRTIVFNDHPTLMPDVSMAIKKWGVKLNDLRFNRGKH